MSITRRHHYLPQFYIKGFVNSDNNLCVYDKLDNQLRQNYSPKRIFFEWNRNTILFEGEEDDYMEKLYSQFENMISPEYNRIKNQVGTIHYELKDIYSLLLLVSLTHWRLPINDTIAEDFVFNSSPKDLFINIFNKENGEEASLDFFNEIKKRKPFIELYRLSKPIIDFMTLDRLNSYQNWLIYGSNSPVKLHLLGDNPIVFKKQPLNNILENEMIFPLTSGITLYHNKGNFIKQIRPEDRVKVDIMVFLQSERYVVGPNKSYLNSIQVLSEGYDTESKIEELRNEIFSIFE
jgi:hypothetical protein